MLASAAGFDGVCAIRCLLAEKIACLMAESSITKCVNESSTAALCNSKPINIHLKKYPNGTLAISVTGSKEMIVPLSPVCVKAEFLGIATDLTCYYNGSASGMLLIY